MSSGGTLLRSVTADMPIGAHSRHWYARYKPTGKMNERIYNIIRSAIFSSTKNPAGWRDSHKYFLQRYPGKSYFLIRRSE